LPNTIETNLTTDGNGRLSIVVPSGTYNLNVKFPGFAPITKRIVVQNATPQTIDVVLKVQSCPPGPCYLVTSVLPVPFPEQSQAVSPDGRYVIVGINNNAEPYHTVFLEDRALTTRRKLLTYDRHIALLWGNDSKSFAVTNYVGSNGSRCTVISVDQKVPPIEVVDSLLRALSKDARERLSRQLSNDHVYVEASVWNSSSTALTVKISGHGDADPSGFTQFYNVYLYPQRP
jgi:hypothetical protein